MAEKSLIHWLHDPHLDLVGATWNLFWGCTRFSPACLNCYIFRQPPLRMRHLRFDKAAVGGKTPIVFADRKVMFAPLRWKRPLMVFVESLGDLWHASINIRLIAEVYAIMLLTPRHIYLTLTKRAGRQRNWLRHPKFRQYVTEALHTITAEYDGRIPAADVAAAFAHVTVPGPGGALQPLTNQWIGVTVEDNTCAAARLPLLHTTPAAVRWASCEPLTNEQPEEEDEGGGPLNLEPWLLGRPAWGPEYREPTSPAGILVQDLIPETRIDWVVLGGESGPAAKASDLDTEPAAGLRALDVDRLEVLIDQAGRAGARVFVKQLGEPWAKAAGAKDRKGGDWDEWPEQLRVRTYPKQLAERALRFPSLIKG